MVVDYAREIQVSEIQFLTGVKRCTKLDYIRNEGIREEQKVFNTNDEVKDCIRQWKEHLNKYGSISL